MGRRHRHHRHTRPQGSGDDARSAGTAVLPRETHSPNKTAASLTPASSPAYHPPAAPAKIAVGDSARMASFGETLRRERELRRITLREVAEATKINIRYLEALERNEFTYLPGGAFTRGFIRACARYIGVDESEMVNAYLYEVASKTPEPIPLAANDPEAGVDVLRDHFQVELGSDERKRKRQRVLVVVLGTLLLLSLLVGGAWWALHGRRSATPVSGSTPAATGQ